DLGRSHHEGVRAAVPVRGGRGGRRDDGRALRSTGSVGRSARSSIGTFVKARGAGRAAVGGGGPVAAGPVGADGARWRARNPVRRCTGPRRSVPRPAVA